MSADDGDRESALRPYSANVRGAAPCYEWVGFGAANAALGLDAATPGGATRHADGRPLALHIAHERWLIPDPTAALLDALAAIGRDGVLTDVTGKWIEFSLPGAAKAIDHPVRLAFGYEQVFEARTCASLMLFDCPVVIVRDEADLTLWLEASYEHSFRAALALIGMRLPATTAAEP